MGEIFLFLALCVSAVTFGGDASLNEGKEQSFAKESTEVLRLELVKVASEIDQKAAREILIRSFMKEYSQLSPAEIDSKLKFRNSSEGEPSVESYYANYFAEEYHNFQQGHLLWVQAKIGDQLVGWATFESEQDNALYMNLLAVDPDHQRKGIGKDLTFSLANLGILPNTRTINLLLRKKNVGGAQFYSRLGFARNPAYQRDNFVDVSLLEGWTFRY